MSTYTSATAGGMPRRSMGSSESILKDGTTLLQVRKEGRQAASQPGRRGTR